jgi:hypothetical protein
VTATTSAARTGRPGPPAPQLIWSNRDVELNDRKPMTGRQAINHVHKHWTGAVAFMNPAGDLEIRRQSGKPTILTGTLPIPEDVHALVADLILDLPLSVRQGDLLTRALEAAADSPCPECSVCAPLRQLLATTAVTR